MSHPLPSPLPRFDRTLLRAVAKIVPAAEREDWARTWHAELWHMHHRGRACNRRAPSLAIVADLSIGLTRDALWLRTESWSRALSGTVTLCLASLLGLCLLTTLIAAGFCDDWRSLCLAQSAQFTRCLVAAVLVIFVTFATAPRSHTAQSSTIKPIYRIKRRLFFAAKTSLVLLLSFLLSADSCRPIHTLFPNTADILQIFLFVVYALLGLRWAFADQQQRCKQCLHLLATPARVGRPSYNLLEWNGTELLCKHGHGLLSVPEIETSWCQSSQWVDLDRRWSQPISV